MSQAEINHTEVETLGVGMKIPRENDDNPKRHWKETLGKFPISSFVVK